MPRQFRNKKEKNSLTNNISRDVSFEENIISKFDKSYLKSLTIPQLRSLLTDQHIQHSHLTRKSQFINLLLKHSPNKKQQAEKIQILNGVSGQSIKHSPERNSSKRQINHSREKIKIVEKDHYSETKPIRDAEQIGLGRNTEQIRDKSDAQIRPERYTEQLRDKIEQVHSRNIIPDETLVSISHKDNKKELDRADMDLKPIFSSKSRPEVQPIPDNEQTEYHRAKQRLKNFLSKPGGKKEEISNDSTANVIESVRKKEQLKSSNKVKKKKIKFKHRTREQPIPNTSILNSISVSVTIFLLTGVIIWYLLKCLPFCSTDNNFFCVRWPKGVDKMYYLHNGEIVLKEEQNTGESQTEHKSKEGKKEEEKNKLRGGDGRKKEYEGKKVHPSDEAYKRIRKINQEVDEATECGDNSVVPLRNRLFLPNIPYSVSDLFQELQLRAWLARFLPISDRMECFLDENLFRKIKWNKEIGWKVIKAKKSNKSRECQGLDSSTNNHIGILSKETRKLVQKESQALNSNVDIKPTSPKNEMKPTSPSHDTDPAAFKRDTMPLGDLQSEFVQEEVRAQQATDQSGTTVQKTVKKEIVQGTTANQEKGLLIHLSLYSTRPCLCSFSLIADVLIEQLVGWGTLLIIMLAACSLY